MAHELLLWFDSVGKDDVERAGGKGANLGELTRAGIPVPPGFIVTTLAYRAFLDAHGLAEQIHAGLDALSPTDAPALAGASARVRALITAAPVPDETAAAIRAAYERLGGGTVAVRSSATAEDLAGASFAGQQATYLNVHGAGPVVAAVRDCWASLFEPQAIAYRAQRGFDHAAVAIAVPVQTMVQAERSGVMFTVNPVTGSRDQFVIEAVWGLGEACVSGMVTPDTYIVDRATSAVLERAPAEQGQELALAPAGSGNEWRAVAPERRRADKLTDGEIATLAALGVRVEEHYGAPQDIEWAMAGGQTYILQARPVTTV